MAHFDPIDHGVIPRSWFSHTSQAHILLHNSWTPGTFHVPVSLTSGWAPVNTRVRWPVVGEENKPDSLRKLPGLMNATEQANPNRQYFPVHNIPPGDMVLPHTSKTGAQYSWLWLHFGLFCQWMNTNLIKIMQIVLWHLVLLFYQSHKAAFFILSFRYFFFFLISCMHYAH